MFDFIYVPVSAILWFWHKVFGYVLDPASGYAWALSVVFLVFTLRALLFKPFVHQVRSMKKMQEFAPLIRELQQKHAGDRQKLAEEMQKLQLEKGFNPVSGCLPVLVQVPVFFGLFQVLNGFKPNAASNYVFNASEVASFVHADLFGAKLSNTISQSPAELASFFTNRPAMMLVGVPLMVAAAIATHFTARHSVARQPANSSSSPHTTSMNQMMLWVFPAFALIGGPFLPLAILLYWLANNVWTLGQQYVVYRKIDREEAEEGATPAVVNSTVVTEQSPAREKERMASESAAPVETVSENKPGEVPGMIENRSREADEPGGTR